MTPRLPNFGEKKRKQKCEGASSSFAFSNAVEFSISHKISHYSPREATTSSKVTGSRSALPKASGLVIPASVNF